MIREEILNAKLIITFIFGSFASAFDLLDCISTLILMMMMLLLLLMMMMKSVFIPSLW